jgi:hypothetical protein
MAKTRTLYQGTCTACPWHSREFTDGNLARMYTENHLAKMSDEGKYGHRANLVTITKTGTSVTRHDEL